MKTAFGDLVLDWRGQRLRRGEAPKGGGGWLLIGEETADILEQLIISDGHRLTGETLWRHVRGKLEAFDGAQMSRMIHDANGVLAGFDCELIVTDFAVRLADVTPRPFLPKREV